MNPALNPKYKMQAITSNNQHFPTTSICSKTLEREKSFIYFQKENQIS